MSALWHRRGATALLFFCLLLLPSSALLAAEATLSDIIVSNTQDDLLVFFQIEGCFTREMEEAILNGIATTFTIFIELYKTRTYWLDASIASIKLEHSIKYDSMRKEFRVTRSEDDHRELVFKDFTPAKKAMTEIKGLKVVPLSSLRRDSEYQLRVKAELEKVRLPMYLHYVFFFVSLWDFETDWYTVDFTF